jgi:hypothetical protein
MSVQIQALASMADVSKTATTLREVIIAHATPVSTWTQMGKHVQVQNVHCRCKLMTEMILKHNDVAILQHHPGQVKLTSVLNSVYM